MDALGEDQHTRLQRKIQRSVLSHKDYDPTRDMKNLIRKKRKQLRAEGRRPFEESETDDVETKPDLHRSATTGASEAAGGEIDEYGEGTLTPNRGGASVRETGAAASKSQLYLQRKLRTLRENQAVGLLRLKEDLLRNPIINLKLQNETGRYAKRRAPKHPTAILEGTGGYHSVTGLGAPMQHRVMLNSRLSGQANSTSYLRSEKTPPTALAGHSGEQHINMVEGTYQ